MNVEMQHVGHSPSVLTTYSAYYVYYRFSALSMHFAETQQATVMVAEGYIITNKKQKNLAKQQTYVFFFSILMLFLSFFFVILRICFIILQVFLHEKFPAAKV